MLEELEARDFIHDAKKLLNIDTDGDFADKIGEKKGTVEKWIQRKKIPLAKKIFIESLIDAMPRDQDAFEFYKNLVSSATNSPINNMVSIPISSAYVHAGKGVVNHEVETKGTIMIDKMLFKILPNLSNISAVEVIGKSMYPTLDEGDYVVIEHNTDFNGEGIYVLSFDDMLLVKRLQASSRGIKILSDNKYYDDDEYDKHDDQRSLFIVGKVILRIQR